MNNFKKPLALDDKKDETSNANSMNDFESWSRDSAPSKVQDKTAIVKQGIQTLQLVSSFWIILTCCLLQIRDSCRMSGTLGTTHLIIVTKRTTRRRSAKRKGFKGNVKLKLREQLEKALLSWVLKRVLLMTFYNLSVYSILKHLWYIMNCNHSTMKTFYYRNVQKRFIVRTNNWWPREMVFSLRSDDPNAKLCHRRMHK